MKENGQWRELSEDFPRFGTVEIRFLDGSRAFAQWVEAKHKWQVGMRLYDAREVTHWRPLAKPFTWA